MESPARRPPAAPPAAPRKRPPKRPRHQRRKRSFLGLISLVVILALAAVEALAIEGTRPHVTGDNLRLDQFLSLVEKGQIKDATELDFDAYFVGNYTTNDGRTTTYSAPVPAASAGEIVLNILVPNRVPSTVDQQVGKKILQFISTIDPFLMLIVLFAYMVLSWRRGTGLFGIKSGARRSRSEETGITFADIAGQDAAIAELREIGEFLAEPKRFVDMGAKIPRGILLYGPPGCGKTLMAKALAAEKGASFLSISGSDFIELYVGVGASRVRDLFREARESAPSVIFVDELDAIGARRSASLDGGERDQALNQLLSEMDGFAAVEGVIVVAATNRPNVLDPALLRPGRFDRTIGLERPNEQGRYDILVLHARTRRFGPDADLMDIARRANGMNGADLANLLNEAALLATRRRRPAIAQEDLLEALQRTVEAPSRQRRLSMRDHSFGQTSPLEEHRKTFADVAGQDAAVAELGEIRDFLTAPDRYAAMGAQIPRGVLLMGPPGCGKTLLARALATEANAAFFSVSASEIFSKWVGESAERVRDLFAEAKGSTPAIIFIDELETLGHHRGGGIDGGAATSSSHEGALNQLLTEMDGFTPSDGVVVVGATNRADTLDPALTRPGRFERHIGMERPDERGRLAILQLHARGKRLGPDADLADIARRAIALHGADLANVLNEAALLATRAGKPAITQPDLDEALKRIIEAPDRQRRLSMRARTYGRRSSEKKVTFADVAGMDDAITELAEIKEYLSSPERFREVGARAPRGIMLIGPPGCGKTMLARAVAGEANAAFFSVAGSEFVEVWVGEGAGRVRDLFAEARSAAPSIVFIDEIDSIGGHRSSFGGGGTHEREQTLNQILVELDGFDARTSVVVMGATNRPDRLDAALVRPGRFDRQVTIDLPNRAGRRAILELHARDKKVGAAVDFDALAGLTRGASGADLENVVNEAALLIARRGLPEIGVKEMDEALERAFMGISSRASQMSDEERRMVAYHEAGHGIVGRALPGASPPHRLTILPRGHSLGATWFTEERDRLIHSRPVMLDQMATALGGRVAELIVFSELTSGASGDLVKVSQMARSMVRHLGMSEAIGPLIYSEDPTVMGFPPAYSDATQTLIDTEVRKLVDEATGRAHAVLTESREGLDRVAEALLQREVLSSDDLEELLGGRPPRAASDGAHSRQATGTAT